jgi:uncharacterized protein (TIGR02118 family)
MKNEHHLPLANAPYLTKISVLYPCKGGRRFDMDYYIETHLRLSLELLTVHGGFRGMSVERGLAGVKPGTKAKYIALCHMAFDSVEDCMAAVVSYVTLLQHDLPNYTDIEPVFQISKVLLQTR